MVWKVHCCRIQLTPRDYKKKREKKIVYMLSDQSLLTSIQLVLFICGSYSGRKTALCCNFESRFGYYSLVCQHPDGCSSAHIPIWNHRFHVGVRFVPFNRHSPSCLPHTHHTISSKRNNESRRHQIWRSWKCKSRFVAHYLRTKKKTQHNSRTTI